MTPTLFALLDGRVPTANEETTLAPGSLVATVVVVVVLGEAGSLLSEASPSLSLPSSSAGDIGGGDGTKGSFSDCKGEDETSSVLVGVPLGMVRGVIMGHELVAGIDFSAIDVCISMSSQLGRLCCLILAGRGPT